MQKRLPAILLLAAVACLLPVTAMAEPVEDSDNIENYIYMSVFLDYVAHHQLYVEYPNSLELPQLLDVIEETLGNVTALETTSLSETISCVELRLDGFLSERGLLKEAVVDLRPFRQLLLSSNSHSVFLDIGMIKPWFFEQVLSFDGGGEVMQSDEDLALWSHLVITPHTEGDLLKVVLEGSFWFPPWYVAPLLIPLGAALLIKNRERSRPFSQLSWGLATSLSVILMSAIYAAQWLFAGAFILGAGSIVTSPVSIAALLLMMELTYLSIRSFYRHSEAKAAGTPISARAAMFRAQKDLVLSIAVLAGGYGAALLGKQLLELHWLAFIAGLIITSAAMLVAVYQACYGLGYRAKSIHDPEVVAELEHCAGLIGTTPPKPYQLPPPWGVELIWPYNSRRITITPGIWSALQPAERRFAVLSAIISEILPWAKTLVIAQLPYVFFSLTLLLLLANPVTALVSALVGIVLNSIAIKLLSGFMKRADRVALSLTGDYEAARGYLTRILEINPTKHSQTKALSFGVRLAALSQGDVMQAGQTNQ